MENNMEYSCLEGLTEEECRQFREILVRLLKGYKEKDETISDEEWLFVKLKEELPEDDEEELRKVSKEIVESIKEYNENFNNLNKACKSGTPKEKWFADKIAESAKGVAINEYGEYLRSLDLSLIDANWQMQSTIMTKSGNISFNRCLDGFIAEQHQVNTFNQNAILQNSPYRAEVCAPLPGKPYGENSFDVIIKDLRTGKRVNQYQFKYGADAKVTINLLKKGNYNNQRFVVPEEQVEAVREAFPNKSVESFIGGDGNVKVKSQPLTKQAVKDMQKKAQEEHVIPTVDWNNYNTKTLALELGREAGRVGVQAAAITVGIDLARKVMAGEKIEADETIEMALKTGTDTGIKTVTAGAIKVASEKGILKIIPQGTPAGIIASIASVGIENIKILIKVAQGEFTIAEALERMGRTSLSMISGLAVVGTGALIGAEALSWVPVVGPIIGSFAGGMLAYMAGSTIGEKVFTVTKSVAQSAKSLVEKTWNKTKEIGSKIKDKFSNIIH